MAFELVLVLAGVVGLGSFVWWLVVLIQAATIPDSTWRAAGQNKLVSVLLIVFTGLIGVILFLAVAKPAIRKAATWA